MSKAMFIAFEGPDGVGKTSTMKGVAQELRKRGYKEQDIVVIRDPGASQLGEALRPVLKGGKIPMTATAQLLLFLSCRAQMAEETIIPALQAGKAVLCDRYTMSTIVYQVLARRNKWAEYRKLIEITEAVIPSVYVVLTADYEVLRKRRLSSRWDEYFTPRETVMDIVAAARAGDANLLKTILGDDEDYIKELLAHAKVNGVETALAKLDKKPTPMNLRYIQAHIRCDDNGALNIFTQWRVIKTGQEDEAVDIVSQERFDDDTFQKAIHTGYGNALSLVQGNEPVIREDTTNMTPEEVVQSVTQTIMELLKPGHA